MGPNNSPITSGPKLVLVDPVALTSKPDESDSSRSVSNLPGYSGTAVGRNITRKNLNPFKHFTCLHFLYNFIV